MEFTRGNNGKARIDPDKCVGCGACIAACPVKAIHMLPGWVSRVDAAKCVGCGTCVSLCHRHAPRLTGPQQVKL
ncbi:MAG: 4Fe-4S binding protein [Firmicutes bacterium]|nr:4Fe-4S binding protein [Bacillota bacterium]MDY6161159.1 4Fe-4S binding protein [Candidatus Faecousia sp.]